jgi:hypothetical protein
MLINEVPIGSLVNVLHDQGIPNTLSGMKSVPIGMTPVRGLSIGSLVLGIAVIAIAAAIVITRAIS